MAEIITFPNAQRVLIDLVTAELATRAPGVTVHPEVPKNNATPGTAKFIVIGLAGGTSETFVTATPLVTVEAYARKRADAYSLCDLVLAIIRSQDGTIRGARGFGYPQPLPDPTTSQVRFTSTGEVRVWGAVTP